MAKISGAGASDVNVDPDYIAAPGMPPQDAMDQGIPDAGQGDEPTSVDEPAPQDEKPARRPAAKKNTDKK